MSRFRKGKRKKQRTKMVVPVRVRLAGTKAQPLIAHTLDATERGVKLAGFHGDVKVADIIEIQHRRESALFRVVWVHALQNSDEKHLGAECVDDTNIWGTDFPAQADEYEEKE